MHLISHPDAVRLGLLLLTMAFLWQIESLAAPVSQPRRWQHTALNARFVLAAAPVQFALGMGFVAVFNWTNTHQFGLLYALPRTTSPLISLVITFLLLDLGEYGYHVLMHKVKTLWRLHLIHHSDELVDVSSVLREHPGETAIRLVFTLLWVFLTGALFWALLLRQCVQIVSNTLVHAHIRLPEPLDRVLGWVLVTPNLHQVHHHSQQPYTDTNYGDVLIIWDRLFGTFSRLAASEVRFGVDILPTGIETDQFGSLLVAPFCPNVPTPVHLHEQATPESADERNAGLLSPAWL